MPVSEPSLQSGPHGQRAPEGEAHAERRRFRYPDEAELALRTTFMGYGIATVMLGPLWTRCTSCWNDNYLAGRWGSDREWQLPQRKASERTEKALRAVSTAEANILNDTAFRPSVIQPISATWLFTLFGPGGFARVNNCPRWCAASPL
jgi:hypothetical protein